MKSKALDQTSLEVKWKKVKVCTRPAYGYHTTFGTYLTFLIDTFTFKEMVHITLPLRVARNNGA